MQLFTKVWGHNEILPCCLVDEYQFWHPKKTRNKIVKGTQARSKTRRKIILKLNDVLHIKKSEIPSVSHCLHPLFIFNLKHATASRDNPFIS